MYVLVERQSAVDGCCLPNPHRVGKGLPALNHWVMRQQVAVLLMTLAATLMPGGGFYRGSLISRSESGHWDREVCVRVHVCVCVCARQQLPLHRGSGAQTAVDHIMMKEEKTEMLAKKKRCEHIPVVQPWTFLSLWALKQTNHSHQIWSIPITPGVTEIKIVCFSTYATF